MTATLSPEQITPAHLPVAVVGLGLMGCSIVTCLLMAGHPVVALAPIPADVPTPLPSIRLIQDIVDRGGRGVANADGFYDYPPTKPGSGRRPSSGSASRFGNWPYGIRRMW